MGRDYFSFKKFTVFQGNTPMKVGTDSVLLGAWTEVDDPKYILDIGTGTGLLALMMAQKFSNAHIDAVEFNKGALLDAEENFKNSTFAERIHLIDINFNLFEINGSYSYDLIISNPPYFKNSLKSPIVGRNAARHQNELDLFSLLNKSISLLSSKGIIALIVPEGMMEELLVIIELIGLKIIRNTAVKSKPEGKIIRRMLELCKFPKAHLTTSELVLHEGERTYSCAVKKLTGDFYLK